MKSKPDRAPMNLRFSLLDFYAVAAFFGLISYERFFHKILGFYDLRIEAFVSAAMALAFLLVLIRKNLSWLRSELILIGSLLLLWAGYLVMSPAVVGVLWPALHGVVLVFVIGIWLVAFIGLGATGIEVKKIAPIHSWVVALLLSFSLGVVLLKETYAVFWFNKNWFLIGVLWFITFYFASKAKIKEEVSIFPFSVLLVIIASASLTWGSMGAFLASIGSLISLGVGQFKGANKMVVFGLLSAWLLPLILVLLFPGIVFGFFDALNLYAGKDVSSNRFEKWEVLLQVLSNGHVWFGLGLSAIPKTVLGANFENLTTAHNLLIVSLLRVGIIGYLVLVILWVSLVRIAIRRSKRYMAFVAAAAAQLFVFSFVYDIGGFTHWQGTVAYLFLFLFFCIKEGSLGRVRHTRRSGNSQGQGAL